MVLIIPLISPGNRLNEPNLFSINFLSRTHCLLQSSTMAYVLRRHIRENNPNKPIDHDEEDGGERQASSKPSFQPRFISMLIHIKENSLKKSETLDTPYPLIRGERRGV